MSSLPLSATEKRKLRAWAAGQDPEKLACRVSRGSHWWPEITHKSVKAEYDPKTRRWNLVGYCQRGCGSRLEYPVARKTGVVGDGHVIYEDGYQWTEKDGNPGGPMTVEGKAIIRAMLLEQKLKDIES